MVTQTLIITQMVSVGVIVGSIVALRTAAEQARSIATEQLTARIIAAKKGAQANRTPVASQLEMLLNRVESLREGAFAPLSSQPIVKAVLVPLLSYSGTILVQFYALPGFN